MKDRMNPPDNVQTKDTPPESEKKKPANKPRKPKAVFYQSIDMPTKYSRDGHKMSGQNGVNPIINILCDPENEDAQVVQYGSDITYTIKNGALVR